MNKVYSSREIIRQLKDDGWYEVRITGSHHHFKHTKKLASSRYLIQKSK